MTRHLPILFTLACGGGDAYDDDTLPTTPSTSETTVPDLVCDPPGRSACGSEGSMIRGQVRVAPGTEGDVTGDVFIGLAHEWLGNAEQQLCRVVDLVGEDAERHVARGQVYSTAQVSADLRLKSAKHPRTTKETAG